MISLFRPKPPPALPGFEHILRYYDRYHQKFAAKIKPGEFYVTTSDEIIVTVLGTCVSVCICDRVNQVGGMNHFYPWAAQDAAQETETAQRAPETFSENAIEQLIESVLQHGGSKDNLELKLFGGSQLGSQLSLEGQLSISFLLDYVKTHSLEVLASDLGGCHARKVFYNPLTGMVRVKKLRNLHNDTIIRRENHYRKELSS